MISGLGAVSHETNSAVNKRGPVHLRTFNFVSARPNVLLASPLLSGVYTEII